jgi:hypothetical protein
MEKEQRKNLEQALAKVITDWVDFLGDDAGIKLEKAIKSAARDLMKKWNKVEKKAAGKEHPDEAAGASVEVLSLPVPSSLKTGARRSSRSVSKAPEKKTVKRTAVKSTSKASPARKEKAPAKAEAKKKSARSAKAVAKK